MFISLKHTPWQTILRGFVFIRDIKSVSQKKSGPKLPEPDFKINSKKIYGVTLNISHTLIHSSLFKNA